VLAIYAQASFAVNFAVRGIVASGGGYLMALLEGTEGICFVVWLHDLHCAKGLFLLHDDISLCLSGPRATARVSTHQLNRPRPYNERPVPRRRHCRGGGSVDVGGDLYGRPGPYETSSRQRPPSSSL
jgi:hypothetical protein